MLRDASAGGSSLSAVASFGCRIAEQQPSWKRGNSNTRDTRDQGHGPEGRPPASARLPRGSSGEVLLVPTAPGCLLPGPECCAPAHRSPRGAACGVTGTGSATFGAALGYTRRGLCLGEGRSEGARAARGPCCPGPSPGARQAGTLAPAASCRCFVLSVVVAGNRGVASELGETKEWTCRRSVRWNHSA